MIMGIIGVALVIWAIVAGFGTAENNRAQVFQSPVGVFVNLLVLIGGLTLSIWGFLF